MRLDPADVWTRCLAALEKKVRKQSFETWFQPVRCAEFCDESVVLEVPNSFFADWLEEYYSPLIKSAILEETSSSPELTFKVVEKDSSEPLAFSLSSETEAPRKFLYERQKNNFNPRYTFDSFVVGTSNRLAHAAAMAVAQAPGATAYNPLVFYGGVGLGKTHILQAIGNYALEHGTAQHVIYTSSERFINDFIESIQSKDYSITSEFNRMYRGADFLLVDDIQFFATTEQTQEAFFHIFNSLYQNRKQIVLTSDRAPGELKGLEERLISRCQWGLVTDVQPPNLETRIAILQKKAEIDGIQLPNEIATYIATKVTTNIRELEGALVRLLARASLIGRDISLELARETFQDTDRRLSDLEAHTQITIECIQRTVAEQLGIPYNVLMSKTRKQEIAEARQVAMYLAKKLTRNSLKIIGMHFGGRDHSTVIHACKVIENRIKLDRAFSNRVFDIQEVIRAKSVS